MDVGALAAARGTGRALGLGPGEGPGRRVGPPDGRAGDDGGPRGARRHGHNADGDDAVGGDAALDAGLKELRAASLLLARLFGVRRPETLDGDDLATERDEPAAHAPPPGAQVVSSDEASVRASLSFTSFHLRVQHTDGDGTTTVELSAFRLEAEVEVTQKDPLVLDLDGDGVHTTGLAAGTVFDIDGDGVLDRMSTVTGGDAFLAWDRDGNGRIDDGRELFGDQHGAADGIAELSRHDSDGDGRITASDALWSGLRLWDPSTGARSLEAAGITAIDLARVTYSGRTTGGDALVDALAVHRLDGTRIAAYDALLATS